MDCIQKGTQGHSRTRTQTDARIIRPDLKRVAMHPIFLPVLHSLHSVMPQKTKPMQSLLISQLVDILTHRPETFSHKTNPKPLNIISLKYQPQTSNIGYATYYSYANIQIHNKHIKQGLCLQWWRGGGGAYVELNGMLLLWHLIIKKYCYKKRK